MRKFVCIMILLSFVLLLNACINTESIAITEQLLNEENLEFNYQKPILFLEMKGKKYVIQNLENYGETGNYWYSFFKVEKNPKLQLLIVFNKNTDTYDYCRFFPETSHFFEDELVCFTIEPNPFEYPLPQLYEITTTVKDFQSGFEKSDVQISRYAASGYDTNIKDFYYKEPFFYKCYKSDIKKNYLSAYDYNNSENDEIFYVLWKQANFPICTTYYFRRSHRFSGCFAYPDINDVGQYRTESEELKPLEDTIQHSDTSKITDEIIVGTIQSSDYECSVICRKEYSKNYNDYSVLIKNNEFSNKIPLDSIFKYQDPLEKIELIQMTGKEFCLIITTSVFSYDLFINLLTGEWDVYLRASSFPEEIRDFE